MEKTKIIFFDIKDYDKEFFKKYEKDYNFEMTFLKVRLTEETANLTKGYDVVCGFANDNINKETIDIHKLFMKMFLLKNRNLSEALIAYGHTIADILFDENTYMIYKNQYLY